jgi:hypothetical protein
MQKTTSTHFEQIPVAAVKKLVEELEKETSGDEVVPVDAPERSAATLHPPEHLHCRKRTLQ